MGDKTKIRPRRYKYSPKGRSISGAGDAPGDREGPKSRTTTYRLHESTAPWDQSIEPPVQINENV